MSIPSPITIHGQALRGSYDRQTAEMKAASLLNLAKELVSDGINMQLSIDQAAELNSRVKRIVALADEYLEAVRAFDRQRRGELTPGERDSFIKP